MIDTKKMAIGDLLAEFQKKAAEVTTIAGQVAERLDAMPDGGKSWREKAEPLFEAMEAQRRACFAVRCRIRYGAPPEKIRMEIKMQTRPNVDLGTLADADRGEEGPIVNDLAAKPGTVIAKAIDTKTGKPSAEPTDAELLADLEEADADRQATLDRIRKRTAATTGPMTVAVSGGTLVGGAGAVQRFEEDVRQQRYHSVLVAEASDPSVPARISLLGGGAKA